MNPEDFTWDRFFASLSPRAQTALRAQDISSFESLCKYRFGDLLALPGVGKTTANELSVKVAKWGMALGKDPVERPSDSADAAMEVLHDAIEEARRLRETTARISLKLPLRDLFAMHAMEARFCLAGECHIADFTIQRVAEQAYQMADAMLAARSSRESVHA